jgi:hypothetical protein
MTLYTLFTDTGKKISRVEPVAEGRHKEMEMGGVVFEVN